MHESRLLTAPVAVLSAAAILVLFSGCGDDTGTPPGPDGGTEIGVRAIFELAADPMDFGAIPWPDDLYLDGEGRISAGALPGESATYAAYYESLRVGFADLDGFGLVTPAFFYFDGALDEASLPAGPEASLTEEATAFLIDVDPASPTAFARVPVEVDFQVGPGRLALRPDHGHPLRPGGRYAAIVTSGVQGTDGLPLHAAESFAAVRDAASRPEDALLGEAYDHYNPVLTSLATNGVALESVAAMALFRVQTVTEDLADARVLHWSGDAPAMGLTDLVAGAAALDARLGVPDIDTPGLDDPSGVQHGNIGFMAHGTFSAPSFLSATEHVHGRFTRDAAGDLVVKRQVTVPFTLLLPQGDLGALPMVVVQHGLGDDRAQALAWADALCADGYGVIALDIPWHGMRLGPDAVDVMNNFTGEMVPDHFGDDGGLGAVIAFTGITDAEAELEPFHPFYMRDAFRQSVSDLMFMVRLVREGDWSALTGADAALSGLSFSADPIALIGYSLGGIIGTELAAMEPEIGVAVLAATGGSIIHLVTESPTYNLGYFPILFPMLGIMPSAIDYEAYHPRFMPEAALWQTLLDRGDSIGYARTLGARPISILMPMARHDESLNNVATESLGRAIGVEMVAAAPLHADLVMVEAPVRDNVSVGGEMVTRAIYSFDPATHGFMKNRMGETKWAHPVGTPFEGGETTTVNEPLAEVIDQIVHFFQSYRAGTAEIAAPR